MSAVAKPAERKDEGKEIVGKGPIICPGHSRPVPDLQYSQVTDDGYFLVSSCLDGKPMIREGVSGDWIGTFAGHKGAVWSARLNASATLLATGSADFTARIWDALSGKELREMPHKHIVKMATFSQDGRHLYTGGAEKKLRVWDLEKTDAEPQVLLGHTATISRCFAAPDANLLISSGDEKGIKVWDLRTMEVVKTLATEAPVTDVNVSFGDGVLAATAGSTVHFFDANTFEALQSYTLSQPLNCVSYHPEVGKFVTGSSEELWARVYDYASGQEIACNKGHHGPVRCISFNPTGDMYASGSEDGTIRIWELENKDKEARA